MKRGRGGGRRWLEGTSLFDGPRHYLITLYLELRGVGRAGMHVGVKVGVELSCFNMKCTTAGAQV